MPGSDRKREMELKDGLRVIGLSDTEIDSYLALLKRGEATTRAVADDADVTQRAVYDIAERLENRGLVQVNDYASPTTIRALAPSESIANLTDRLELIAPELENQFNETEPKAPEIRMVKSRETAVKRLRSAISEAEHEVALSIPEPIYQEVEPELRAAAEQDVFVLLLLGDATNVDGNWNRFTGVADVVRYWNEDLTFLCVADDTAAMIGDPGLLSGTHATEEAVVVTQRNLAGSIMGLHLSGYWPAATEAFVTDPDPLPQTFDWFREALLHATLHWQAGTTLQTDIVTTDGTELSGEIIQIRQALIEPVTNEFTLEASLVIQTDQRTITVGGRGFFVEDYEAKSISIRPDS